MECGERRRESSAGHAVRSTAVCCEVPLTVHVVAHTHWDREWYQPAVRFQARLVALVDALLASDADAKAPFLLDGQTVVLEDYLALRPDRREQVVRALAEGALEAGPWYVLADNLIPSGEAIVRNLEAGRRWLARHGATAPRVAYCPDTFGHPAAMPLIAQGFGCEVAIVWRGFGGTQFPAIDTCWWRGADGSRVVLYHLPPDGYEFGSGLPIEREAVRARWRSTAAVLSARNRTGQALLTCGADHHAPQPDLLSRVAGLLRAARAEGAMVQRSGLSGAAESVHQAALAQDRVEPLPIVTGELRDSYGYTWTLPGTLATRAHQKRGNARAERLLLHDVEPWLALAWLFGDDRSRSVSRDGALSMAQLPTLTQSAWEMLLRTHPHDTLCGCSVDDVARDMSAQQRRVTALGVELREAALSVALRHDRNAARERSVMARPPAVIRNRVAYARGGVAELRLIETLGDVRVGPGSSSTLPPAIPDLLQPPSLGACLTQSGAVSVEHARRESPQHYPDDDLVRVHRVLAWVPEVPALGVRVVSADAASPDLPVPVVVVERDARVELSNGRITVVASRDGVAILDGERMLANALSLETMQDAGDSYTPALRGPVDVLALSAIRVGARGPLRASVLLSWHWRSGGERIRVRTELILDAAATYVRCNVRVVNARRNHRLQLICNTDVGEPSIIADAAFGPVRRESINAPATYPPGAPVELPPTTMPLHRWLATHDAERGVTMLSDGLAEGEASRGRLAVTLLRAIGELSRHDLSERPGHAGWPNAIPAAQCQGVFGARVGLMMHGTWSDAVLRQVERASDALLMPLIGETWRDLEATRGLLEGPALIGSGLVASAVTVGDDGESLVLRAVNVTEQVQQGAWQLPQIGELENRAVRLDGTPLPAPLGTWVNRGHRIEFTAPARGVVTIEVRRLLA